MRIGIDVTFLFDQYSHRGIGYYGREIVSRLVADTDHTWILFGFKDLQHNLSELGLRKKKNIKFVSLGRSRSSNPFNVLFSKLFYNRKIKNAKLDVYFTPHFERGIPLGATKIVVMMHDVIPYVTGHYSDKGGLTNFLKGLFYRYNLRRARKADVVLTNSDFSKRELIQKAGFSSDVVSRIHLGISERFRIKNISAEAREIRRVLIMYKITKPYLLYYGGFENNKNVSSLINAFAIASQRHPDLKLVLAGKDFKVGWDNKPVPQSEAAKSILGMIGELKLRHKVVITGEVEEKHLPLILSNAKAFIHLSTYEGFGFSVLEAGAAGVPVIAPRRSSYPEVLGESARFVRADDPDNIASVIQDILQDENLRKRLHKEGISNAERFRWSETLRATLSEIERIGEEITPIKIAYVIPYFHPFKGGAENNALELASRMVKLGHKVTVFTSQILGEEHEKDETYAGIQIRRFKRLNKAYYLGIYPGLLPALLMSRFDAIHVHGFGFVWQDIVMFLKRIFSWRCRLINTPHGPFMAHSSYSFGQRLMRAVYTQFLKILLPWTYHAVIEVNPTQRDWIKGYRINPKKIFYIANGIPEVLTKVIPTNKVEKDFGLKNRFVISFIGRFEKYKGFQDLIRAFSEIKDSRKSLRVVAIGREGQYLNKIESMIDDLKLRNQVLVLTDASDKIKEQILELSEIFVLPSQWEAFGISILEAMAKGNAIISTRTEGGEFLIDEEKNGLLYDYGDEKELQNHLTRLINDRSLRKKMQLGNRNKAEEFTWERVIVNYNNLIRHLTR
ncbi:MAG: glycosyltransferase [Candidatus Dojkabacteria bacterium]